MAQLKDKFNKIISDIENNIENKKDLDYIKTQIYNISILFIDELDKLADLNMNKMNALIEKNKELNEKMNRIESVMNLDETSDFEIVCPYCNHEFIADFSTELKKEVTCPECNNVIELDWNEEEQDTCGGHCSGCHSDCGHDEENDEQDNNQQEDDDM